MDYHRPRSQSVLHIHPPISSLSSRASRILAKVTNFKGRIRLHTTSTISHNSTSSKDDSASTTATNNPYHTQTRSMDGNVTGGLKPYMSHPILSNMLVEPFVPEDGSDQSASPNSSEFRRALAPAPVEPPPISAQAPRPPSGANQHQHWGGLPTPRAETARTSFDGLPNSSRSSDAATRYNNNNNLASSTKQKQHRTTPSIVISNPDTPFPATHHQPTLPPPPASTTASSPSPRSSHDSPRSTSIAKNSASAVVQHKHNRPKPIIDTALTSTNPPTKAKNKSFSPARLFARKASRSRLQNADDAVGNGRDDDQPPTPHPRITMKPVRPPTSVPPLPPLPTVTTSTSLPLPASKSLTNPKTPNFKSTPALTTSTPVDVPPASSPGVSTPTLASAGKKAISAIPPRLTLPPHNHRFSLTMTMEDGTAARLSPSVILRRPPLPILNLPTLPPVTPISSASLSPPISGSGSTGTTSSGVSGSSSTRGARGNARRLREMPELPHHGGGRYADTEGDDDDLDDVDIDIDVEDPEGARFTARSASALSQSYSSTLSFGLDSDAETLASTFTVDQSGQLLARGRGRDGGRGKTHSRSSSYVDNNDDHTGDEREQGSYDGGGTGARLKPGLALPGVDTSRLDLGFFERPAVLDDESSLPPVPLVGLRTMYSKGKGKGKARQESHEQHYNVGDGSDDDIALDTVQAGRTPTSGAPYGDYFSLRGAGAGVGVVLPTRTDSLKLRTGAAGGGGGGGGGMRTPRPGDALLSSSRIPAPPLKASLSLGRNDTFSGASGPGGVMMGHEGGGGAGVAHPPTRPGMYKHASKSLIDIRTVERRESLQMVLRAEQEAADEEERKRRRRRSRMELSVVGEVGKESSESGGALGLVVDEKLEVANDVDEDGKNGKKDNDAVLLANEAATTTTLEVPNATNTKRWSKAPPYENNDDFGISPALRRRRSMPTFGAATADPPPYPEFTFPSHSRNMHIQPRDDEGRERLPPYSNSIYLRAELPRKMEFVSVGVQAKDRKWRRVVCVVEGTALKIYRCPKRARKGKSVFGDWWERKVGVGDVALSSLPVGAGTHDQRRDGEGREGESERIHKLGVDMGESGEAGQTELVMRRPATPITPITPERTQPHLSGYPYASGQPSTSHSQSQSQIHHAQNNSNATPASRSRLNLAVNLFKTHTRTNSDTSSIQQFQQQQQQHSPRPSLNIPGSSGGSGGSGGGGARSPTPATLDFYSNSSINLSAPSSSSRPGTASSFYRPSDEQGEGGQHQPQSDPDHADLIRGYTMQNAESGLGNDYIKRKNVIRVRVEGEQFLLQAKDVTDVVAWIEALQASANIALDLDERVMPKGPLFPRRRRRRPRPAATTEVVNQATEGS